MIGPALVVSDFDCFLARFQGHMSVSDRGVFQPVYTDRATVRESTKVIDMEPRYRLLDPVG